MTFGQLHYSFKGKHLEAWFWITAIIVLAISDPANGGHSSLCIMKQLNIGFCPGCGLGHSIAWLFRGNIINSFQAHPLGVPAIIILLNRSFNLLNKDFTFNRDKSLN